MRIERLSGSPDRSGRYFLLFADGSSMRLYRQTVEDFGLYPGKELDDDQYTALREAAGTMSAKMRAVRIVTSTSVSKRDLQQRLIRKGEDPTQAEEAVTWMEELDLIDDQKTAEQIVSRCISKGYGLAKAKQALYEKQIPREYWQEALADYPDQTDSILRFLRSRLSDSPSDKDVKRATDALLRRGHSWSSVSRALRMLALDADEFREDD